MGAEHPFVSPPSSPVQLRGNFIHYNYPDAVGNYSELQESAKRVDTSVTYEDFKDSNIWCHHRTYPKKIKRATNSLSHPRELIVNV